MEDGALRVTGTRVPIEVVVQAFWDGCAPEEIMLQYPSLSLSQVYSVLGYYLRHREAVDRYVQATEERADQVRAMVERQPGYAEFRQRLLARRAADARP